MLFAGLIAGITAIFKGVFNFFVKILNIILEKINFLIKAIKYDEENINRRKNFFKTKEKYYNINNEL